jgi:hypothetical protein
LSPQNSPRSLSRNPLEENADFDFSDETPKGVGSSTEEEIVRYDSDSEFEGF